MTPIRVSFKTRLMNPEYHFGAAGQTPAQIEVAGDGWVVAFPATGNAIVVARDTGRFYQLGLSEITFIAFSPNPQPATST